MVPEHELTVGVLEIIAADLLSDDPRGWRPGETLHTSPGLGHAVADAPLVEYVGGTRRVVAELRPELHHEGAHGLPVAGVARAPSLAKQ